MRRGDRDPVNRVLGHAASARINSAWAGLLTGKSDDVFRVGIFLEFVWLTTRTMHPHGAYVRGAKLNRINRRRGGIGRLVTRTRGAWRP